MHLLPLAPLPPRFQRVSPCAQLLAEPATAGELGLASAEEYHYLNQSGCTVIEGRDEARMRQETLKCMGAIGMAEEQQAELMRLLCGVLKLGNLAFPSADEQEGEQARPPVTAQLEVVASHLAVEPEDLVSALCYYTFSVPGSTIRKRQSDHKVSDTRDTLAKAIYSNLFLYLVDVLNRTIKSPSKPWGYIGVLDIYGFENFDHNSLEQLVRFDKSAGEGGRGEYGCKRAGRHDPRIFHV